MKANFLKAAGVQSEEEFYQRYPNEEDFFNEYPEMAMGGQPDEPQAGIYPGLMPQYGFGQSPYGAPAMNPGFASPEMNWGDPGDLDRFAIEESQNSIHNTPVEESTALASKKLKIKDYLKAGTDRLQQNSDKFMAAYNNPTSAINILGYAGSLADRHSSNKKTKQMEQFFRNQFSSDNMFGTVPGSLSGDRGDYNTTGTSYGMFRPDEMGAKSPYGMAFGGEGPDDPILKARLAGVKPRPYQPNISLPGWDGMVEKADGSIGMWGNDITQRVPMVIPQVPFPQAYTDHVGRQSGSYYQGQPTADQKIQMIRERLMREAAAAPMKRYKKGGEYSVTQEELAALLASGADIEFI